MTTHSTPSSASPDQKLLHRVRSLLAKAESTTFADEASALTAKAHELMAVHAIDQAMVQADRGDAVVTSRRVIVQAPYAKQKFSLLSAVADPNRCKAILGIQEAELDIDLFLSLDHGTKIATVFGYETDLAVVETLFTSLLLQAVNIMLDHGSVVDEFGDTRTRSFRSSFIQGYAWTVGRRLTDVQGNVDATADQQQGGALLPVLASRSDNVDAAVADAFPTLGTLRTSVRNPDGIQAGASAATRADIGHSRVGAHRRALP